MQNVLHWNHLVARPNGACSQPGPAATKRDQLAPDAFQTIDRDTIVCGARHIRHRIERIRVTLIA